MRKLLGVIDNFSILTMVIVSYMTYMNDSFIYYIYDSFIKLDILKVCTLLCVNDALLHFKQNKANKNIESHQSLVPIVSW